MADATPTPATGHSRLSEEAGRFVTQGSVWFVIGLLFLTIFQIWLWYFDRAPIDLSMLPEDCGQINCAIFALEAQVQEARSLRALDLIVSRHVIALVGMVIVLAFLVLGAVLIFNRIKSQQEGVIEVHIGETAKNQADENGAALAATAGRVANGNGPSPGMFSVRSTFPGLLMCGCAVLSLWSVLYFSYRSYKTNFIRDGAVFLPDHNFCRNVLNRQPGIMNTASVERQNDEFMAIWSDMLANYRHCFKTTAEVVPAISVLTGPKSADLSNDKTSDELIGGE